MVDRRLAGLPVLALALGLGACDGGWTSETLRLDARTIRIEIVNETDEPVALSFKSTTTDGLRLVLPRSRLTEEHVVEEPRQIGSFPVDERVWSLALGRPVVGRGGEVLGVREPVSTVAEGQKIRLDAVLIQIRLDADGARWRAIGP